MSGSIEMWTHGNYLTGVQIPASPLHTSTRPKSIPLVYESLHINCGLIQNRIGLLVKVEVLAILGEVKNRVYISVLLYSIKWDWLIKLFSVLSIEACWLLSDVFSLSSLSIFFFSLITDTVDTAPKHCKNIYFSSSLQPQIMPFLLPIKSQNLKSPLLSSIK